MKAKNALLALAALTLFSAARAAAQSIDYLPRNEELDTLSTGESVTLGEVSCPEVDEILQRARACQECVQLKTGCPDCCLVTAAADKKLEVLKCATRDDAFGTDPALNCHSDFRFGPDCPQAAFTSADIGVFNNLNNVRIPHAQLRGCPGLAPDGTAAPILPVFRGCGTYFSSFEEDCFNPPATPKAKPQPTAEYSAFVAACAADADARELCAKNSEVCKSKLCGGVAGSCIDDSCRARLTDWERADKKVKTADGPELECWALNSAHCLKLQKIARNCLSGGVDSPCFPCFKRIYPSDGFVYKFVPRSGQKLVFLWKLFVTSVGSQSASTYFYSKVQVEDERGRPVYSSPVHQRVFEGSFSIFSAISVPEGILKTGDEYFVRLYYFINSDPALDLRMKVDGAEITTVKVRE